MSHNKRLGTLKLSTSEGLYQGNDDNSFPAISGGNISCKSTKRELMSCRSLVLGGHKVAGWVGQVKKHKCHFLTFSGKCDTQMKQQWLL